MQVFWFGMHDFHGALHVFGKGLHVFPFTGIKESGQRVHFSVYWKKEDDQSGRIGVFLNRGLSLAEGYGPFSQDYGPFERVYEPFLSSYEPLSRSYVPFAFYWKSVVVSHQFLYFILIPTIFHSR
jgi:hypothetical protein